MCESSNNDELIRTFTFHFYFFVNLYHDVTEFLLPSSVEIKTKQSVVDC